MKLRQLKPKKEPEKAEKQGNAIASILAQRYNATHDSASSESDWGDDSDADDW